MIHQTFTEWLFHTRHPNAKSDKSNTMCSGMEEYMRMETCTECHESTKVSKVGGMKKSTKASWKYQCLKHKKMTEKWPGEGRQSRSELCKQRKMGGKAKKHCRPWSAWSSVLGNSALLQKSTAKKERTKEQESHLYPLHASMPHTCQ